MISYEVVMKRWRIFCDNLLVIYQAWTYSIFLRLNVYLNEYYSLRNVQKCNLYQAYLFFFLLHFYRSPSRYQYRWLLSESQRIKISQNVKFVRYIRIILIIILIIIIIITIHRDRYLLWLYDSFGDIIVV